MKKIKSDEANLSIVNQVVKSNRMIESMYQLSAVEHKLIASLCSKISSNDNVFNTFELSVSEFANFMGIDNKNFELNRTLKKKCEELARRTLTINLGTDKKPNWYIFNWFHHIQYEVGKGVISMQFHESLEPFLLNIQETYTKYKLGYVMNFKYEHSFRIYELMKEYEKAGERVLLVDELKSMLFTNKGTSYQKYSHFKASVINKALEEINKFSDINVTLVKEEKQGKKVVGLVFEIKPHNYKLPIDILQDAEEIRKLPKKDIQKMLKGIILKYYKIELREITTDLFEKEAIAQLYIELKNGEYEERNIKNPLPYFTEVLIKKHGLMTGETITKTDIRRYEVEKMKEEIYDLSEGQEVIEIE